MFKRLFFVLLWEINFPSTAEGAEENKYEIIRQLYSFPQQKGDRFKLPPILCTPNWKTKCAQMGGTNTEINCTCSCTEGSKNVFGHFGNLWKCTSNRDVRYSGCQNPDTYFEGERGDLNFSLRLLQPEVQQIGTLRKSCEFERQISYLDCYGKWIDFNQNSSFGFPIEANDSLSHSGKLILDKYSPQIYGHIIKINMKCTAELPNPNEEKMSGHCVLLKVTGKQSCSAVPSTTAPPVTSTSSTTTIQSPSSSTPSTSSLTSSTTTQPRNVDTTTTSNNEQKHSTGTQQTTTTSSERATTASNNEGTTTNRITATEKPTTNPSSRESSTSQTIMHTSSTIRGLTETVVESTTSEYITDSPNNIGGVNDDSEDNSGVAFIGGVAGAAVVLVIIVVLLIAIFLGRENRHPRVKRESVTPIAENAFYETTMPINGQLRSVHNEHPFAFYNNHLVVIKDQSYEEITDSSIDKVHNGIIEVGLGSPPNHGLLVYGTREDPNYDHLYNSHETFNDPSNSYSTLERPGKQRLEQVYVNVLEDPNSTSASVYHVPKEPSSNEHQVHGNRDPHLYGSLDSEDPRVNGFHSSTSKSASGSDIYDIVGSTIEGRDTLNFTELNQAGQQSSDIYQPLRYPSDTLMAMKNIK